MAKKLICGKCGGPIVFRREDARVQRIYFNEEDAPALDDDPLEAESVEGLFCTACETWYADEADDVLEEIPKLLDAGTLRVVETSDAEEEEGDEEEPAGEGGTA
jgi:uncharacterized protein YbaR (Trm112 family)